MTPDPSNDPTIHTGEDTDAEVLEHPERIGPYKILQVIGEGGMGVVYHAEQTAPVQRRVALKMMKVGMDTREVVARFEAERQALAVMDHPNIAKVLDAGASETGRPYFVMEHVKGVPLTDYCDTNKLSTKSRLELFIPICQAVQHAHQKGVIHRDLKPSNVLVTVQQGTPAPKIIDFGIAKAIGQRLTEKTLVTAYGVAMGTPAYMSPEQAEMTGLDVDTRTDVYSLGVMLYELLVGRLPVDPDEIGLQGFMVQLVLRETETPTPSAKLSRIGEAKDTVAYLRATDPPSLRKELRGDLDWIVMKAMEKDRTRRYETANGLALDIRRHLRHEPVLARAPSAVYWIGKFARRHRAGVGFAATVLLLVIGFAVAVSLQAARIARERDRASLEAETAAQVSEFLVSVFEVSDPNEALGNTITAREILDRAAERIDSELTDNALQARLMATVGRVYRNLGLYSPAADVLERAVAAARRYYGERHEYVANQQMLLASIYAQEGRYEEAMQVAEQALRLRQELAETPTLAIARALNNVAGLHRTLGNLSQALSQYQQALEIAEALEADDETVATFLSSLALVHQDMGDYQAAETLLQRAVGTMERTLAANDPVVAGALTNLADNLRLQGKWAAADSLYARSLEIMEGVYDPGHPALVGPLMGMAIALSEIEEYDRSSALLRRAMQILEDRAPDHPDRFQALDRYASVLRAMGRTAQADSVTESARQLRVRTGTSR